MAPAVTNRFSLFEDGDEERPHAPLAEAVSKINQFTNQVADSDAPWEAVRSGGPVRKTTTKTLVIRSEKKPSLVRSPTKQKPRDSSGFLHESNSMVVSDSHEYWCGVCQYRFANKNALLMHIKQSPQGHENYCNLCKRVRILPTAKGNLN